ncbi:MAG: hypothetical protein ACKVT1_09415 [Dehalococcoidia bacterium]
MRILRAIARWPVRTWRGEAPDPHDLVDGRPGNGPPDRYTDPETTGFPPSQNGPYV